MILQIDQRFDQYSDIQKYGCHFMSELYLINRCGNVPLSTGIIVAAFEALTKKLASYQPDPANPTFVIGKQCSMNNPDDVVSYFDMAFEKPCRMEDTTYICEPGEQELLQFTRPGWWHWVAGDGKGNVAYDPEGYSLTVAEGSMARKKIFTIVHKGVNA